MLHEVTARTVPDKWSIGVPSRAYRGGRRNPQQVRIRGSHSGGQARGRARISSCSY